MVKTSVAAVALSTLAAAGAGMGAGAAQAAWTAPATLGPSGSTLAGAIEPAPRAAIGGDGTILATWVRFARTQGAVYAAVGDRRGRFAAAQRLGRGLRPAVAVGARGAGLVVFEGHGDLRVAVRRPGARGFGAARVLVAAPANGAGNSFPLVGIDAGGTALVVYEHGFRGKQGFRTYLRGLRVDARTGRAVGGSEDLGPAGLPRGATLEPGPRGGLSLLITTRAPGNGLQGGPPQVLTWAPAEGTATRSSPEAPDAFAEGVLGGDGTGRLALAGVSSTIHGDAGSAGFPVAAALGGDPLTLSAPFAGPGVRFPNRTFGTVAAPLAGGGLAMAYQQKARPEGFSRQAPVMATTLSAAGRPGPAVRLSARKGAEPQIVALQGGALTVWDDAGRFGAARRSHGGWHRVVAPRGAVVPFHDYVTNRRLVAGGSTAVLVWEASRSIRLSVLRP
ncbi:MAG: hypothetical protein JWN65_2346 [Solirubrobacterales bacterium]|nr:hypothetical protein [Solirubrobacterales bacterium]